jgi:hypothetical protein
MEFRHQNIRRNISYRSPDLKALSWLENRIVVGKYSYSVKNLIYTILSSIVIIIAAVYFITLYRINRADPNAAIQRETNSLTLKIGRFMELPKGEVPTLATVTDKQKLKGQDFFANAKNGDKLLIYQKAKKAILYRPSTEKIIDVTNLTSASQNSNSAPVQPSP